MSAPVDAALTLAVQGLPVFPCYADKCPATRRGFYDATKDPERIRRFFALPRRLIGVPTGAASGIAVLDIDPRHDGDRWAIDNFDSLPRTRVHATRSGGFHLIFRHLDGVINSAGLIAPGVDVRGEGGYIIYWPAHGCEVVDDVPLDRLASWPDWIAVPPPDRPKQTRRGTVIPDRYHIERLCNFVASSPEGERNSRLFWASCRRGEMLFPGMLDAAAAETLLGEVASDVGLSEREARSTIRSGLARTRSGP
jgi:hypothetical protein